MKVGDPKLDAIVKRPVKHLAHFTGNYRGIWGEHDRIRNEYKKLAKWPQWCYAPGGVSVDCLSGIPDPDQQTAFSVACLGAWRLTKGIYVFDEAVFDALWGTDVVKGPLPVELLQRLPEWCVYVPFPTPRILEYWFPVKKCFGFFAHLDWSREDGAVGLILCLDFDNAEGFQPGLLHAVTFKLVGDLSESCGVFYRNADACLKDVAPTLLAGKDLTTFQSDLLNWADKMKTDLIRPLMAILLYLCSTEPDIHMDPFRGLRTRTVKTKKTGVRNFGPDQPAVHKVGYVIGAAVRLAKEAAVRGKSGEGTHASPRTHIRRPHFQTYWVGQRALVTKGQPTERRLELRWKGLILVCAESGDTIIPTVHPVLPPKPPMDQLDSGAMR